MAEPSAGNSATDTGIPPDMLAESEIGKEPAPRGDVTGLAARLGWKPKEEWRGAEDKWLDAPDYIGEVERETPKVRERVRTQKEIISAQQAKIEEIAASAKKQDEKLTELLDNQRNANLRGFEYRRDQIDQAMERAVAEADIATYKNLKAERDALDKQRPAVRTQTQVVDPPAAGNGQATGEPSAAVKQFMRDNSWFGFTPGKNRAMSSFAMEVNREVNQENPGMSESEQLAEVRMRLEKEFPHKFENQARKAPGAVAQPGAQALRQPKPKGKTVADLDDGARERLAYFKRTIKGYTDKDFLDSYKWDDKS